MLWHLFDDFYWGWNGIDGVLFFDLVAGDGIWLLHCKVIQLSFFVCDFLLTFLLLLDMKKNFADT